MAVSSRLPVTLQHGTDALGGGSYQPVNEVFEPRFVLTTSQQQYEAKANAERTLGYYILPV